MPKSKPAPRPHYLKLVEWSEAAGYYIGRCPELSIDGIRGADETKVYAALCTAVTAALAHQAGEGGPLPASLAGKTFSGKFLLRTTPAHHQRLAIRALQAGESLNNYIVKQLQRAESRRAAR